jgi:hypothetical protein
VLFCLLEVSKDAGHFNPGAAVSKQMELELNSEVRSCALISLARMRVEGESSAKDPKETYNRPKPGVLVTLLTAIICPKDEKEKDMTSASSSTAQVAQLLMAWSEGDQSALETLTPLVQQELHRLAHHYMEGERPGHTLQTTALINEGGRAALLRRLEC